MDTNSAERGVWTMLAVVIAAMVGLVAGIMVSGEFEDPPAVCHSVTENTPMLDCDYSNGTWYPTEDVKPVEVYEDA